jgi:N-terminal 7TM region of histidine kinase
MTTHTFLFPLVNGFTGIVFFSVAAIAWLRAPRSRLLRLWFVYCLLFATYTWSVVAAGVMAPTIEWADKLIRLAMTVGSTSSLILYYFGLTYSGTHPRKFHIAHIFVPWWAILQGLFWVTNLIQANVNTTSYVSKWAPMAGPAMPFYLLFALLCHLLPVIFVTRRYRRERGQDRIQAAYMLVALSIGSIASICSLLPSIVPSRSVLLWIPAMMLPIYPLIITYAIIRHRLLDVRTVIHKTLVYAAALMTSGLVVYFVMRAEARLVTTLPADEFSVVLLGLFLLVYGFIRLVKPRIDHYFQRRSYDPATATKFFAQRSAGVVDRNAWLRCCKKYSTKRSTLNIL